MICKASLKISFLFYEIVFFSFPIGMDMIQDGKINLARKSFCIDGKQKVVYNCLINTKKGELSKDEIS